MKKEHVFLLQKELMPKEELEAICVLNTNFSFSRVNLANRLIIPRYGLLPFAQEMHRDIEFQNSKIINSLDQHNYIANFEYYKDISFLTPKTYFSLDQIPNDSGKLVVKGLTNSKKNLWNTHMFANNKQEAMEISFRLQEDKYMQNQDVIYREYIKLETPEIGINGLPFANEWRFFVYNHSIIDYGYYWTIAEKKGHFDDGAIKLVNKVITQVGSNCCFYVVDVAKTESGEWIVIELNDGCMSGLSDIDPKKFYSNFVSILKADRKILF